KSSLRRFRQRPRKLPFAHRANQKPKARRSPCQNLLPRYPKPLREDRAQAFVALDNIPKRSFQRPHIQLASKPNRQWDRVAPASPLPPAQKTTAGAANTPPPPHQDAHPHVTLDALHPPPPAAQPAPLPSASQTGCGSIPQPQGSNACG